MFGFTSISFLFIFMPLSILGYILISLTKRNFIIKLYLLFISLLFWGCIQYKTLFMLIPFILEIYLIGNLMRGVALQKGNAIEFTPIKRKSLILIPCIIIILILFYFKLYTELNKTDIGKKIYSDNPLIIPIGFSFILFNSISYLVDIYRGEAPGGSFIDVALYLVFFPKLLSGPIALWKDFSSSVNYVSPTAENIWQGMERICIGYAKKAIVADTLSSKIDEIHNVMCIGVNGYDFSLVSPPPVDVQTYWLCALLYMFRIYFDFSGYSDIAIGLCYVFGYKIKENFNFPYISKSVGEFWRRWHISLGTWFKEYVYIPLGGNRRGNIYINLMIVFLLTGIWHGIGWPFFLWGVLNGVAVVIERFCSKHNIGSKIPDVIKHLYLLIFVFFAWLLFSMPNLATFLEYGKNMLKYRSNEIINFSWLYYLDGRIVGLLLISFIGSILAGLPIIQNTIYIYSNNYVCRIIRDIVYIILFIVSILFMVTASYSPFIYFQF